MSIYYPFSPLFCPFSGEKTNKFKGKALLFPHFKDKQIRGNFDGPIISSRTSKINSKLTGDRQSQLTNELM